MGPMIDRILICVVAVAAILSLSCFVVYGARMDLTMAQKAGSKHEPFSVPSSSSSLSSSSTQKSTCSLKNESMIEINRNLALIKTKMDVLKGLTWSEPYIFDILYTIYVTRTTYLINVVGLQLTPVLFERMFNTSIGQKALKFVNAHEGYFKEVDGYHQAIVKAIKDAYSDDKCNSNDPFEILMHLKGIDHELKMLIKSDTSLSGSMLISEFELAMESLSDFVGRLLTSPIDSKIMMNAIEKNLSFLDDLVIKAMENPYIATLRTFVMAKRMAIDQIKAFTIQPTIYTGENYVGNNTSVPLGQYTDVDLLKYYNIDQIKSVRVPAGFKLYLLQKDGKSLTFDHDQTPVTIGANFSLLSVTMA